MKNFFWPEIKTVEEARKAVRPAANFCFLAGGVVILFAVLSGYPTLYLLLAIIAGSLLLAIGFGFRKMSRICSGTFLFTYTSLFVFQLVGYMKVQPEQAIHISLSFIIFGSLFIRALRGTFVFHQISPIGPPPLQPVTAQWKFM